MKDEKMSLNFLYKNHRTVILGLLLTFVLLLFGALMMNWYHIGRNIMNNVESFSSWSHIVLTACYVSLPILIGMFILQLCSKIRSEQVIKWTGLGIYLLILTITLITLIVNNSSENKMYLNIGGVYALYVPALYGLAIIPGVFFICKCKEKPEKFFTLLLGFLIPASLSIVCFRSGFDVEIELVVVMLALMIKMIKEKKLSIGYLLFFIGLIIFFYIILLCSSSRSALLLESRDYSEFGLIFSEMSTALKQSKFIGISDYCVHSATNTMPGYLYFASLGKIYLPLCLILRFGWFSVFIPLLICVSLAMCFFKMSSKTSENIFSRYITFAVGSYIIGKTAVAYIGCFYAPLNGGVLPFCGNCSFYVDAVLCAFAIAVYLYQQEFIVCENTFEFLTGSNAEEECFDKKGGIRETKAYKIFLDSVEIEDQEETIKMVDKMLDDAGLTLDVLFIEGEVRYLVKYALKIQSLCEKSKKDPEVLSCMRPYLESLIETAKRLKDELEEDDN